MRIVGIDPGFANIGVADVRVLSGLYVLEELAVIRTEKTGLPAREDTIKRAQQIALELDRFVRRADVLAIEAMSYPRNASAAAKMAMCYGVIAALAMRHGCEIAQFSPKAAKKAVCGDPGASKEVVQESVQCYFSEAELRDAWKSEVPPSLRNHAYDALSIVIAGKKERSWKQPL